MAGKRNLLDVNLTAPAGLTPHCLSRQHEKGNFIHSNGLLVPEQTSQRITQNVV